MQRTILALTLLLVASMPGSSGPIAAQIMNAGAPAVEHNPSRAFTVPPVTINTTSTPVDSFSLATLSSDVADIANPIAVAHGLLGVATLLSARYNLPTTPLLAKIMASRAVDVTSLVSALYLTGHTLMTAGNLPVVGLSLALLGQAVHVNAYAIAAREFFIAKNVSTQELGFSNGEANSHSALPADGIRRFAQDPTLFLNAARGHENVLQLSTVYSRISPFISWAISKTPLASTVLAGWNLVQMIESGQPLTSSLIQTGTLGLGWISAYLSARIYGLGRASSLGSSPARTEELSEELILEEAEKEELRSNFERTMIVPLREEIESLKNKLKEKGLSFVEKWKIRKQIWSLLKDLKQREMLSNSVQSTTMRRLCEAYGTLPTDAPTQPAPEGTPILPRRHEYQAKLDKLANGYETTLPEIVRAIETGELPTVLDLASEEEQAMNIQATSNNLQTTSAFADLDSSLKNISFSKLQSTNPSLAFHLLCGLSVTDYQAAYRKGILTPLDVFNALILSPDWSENPALFPTGRNPQAIAFYRQLAEESSIRWKNGNILSEYDGIFIATKDLFASPNGKGEYEATLGSVATLVRSDKPSYIVDKYQKLGMISIPVGSVTGGMGGDERNVAGSRLDNRVPLNEQIMFDENGEVTVGTTLAGSSSASIYSLRQSIFALSTGTDTGGSVKAPASMVAHVAGFVPKQNQESREGLYPSHVGLDHVGFLARGAQATEEVMKFATAVHEDWKSAPSSQKPIVVCLKDDIDSLETEIQSSFLAQIENLRSQGITVVVLDDPRYSKILGEFQTDVYGPYHVVGNAVAAMNPTQTQRFEPPRYGYILDPNAADDRYLKAEAAFGFYPRFKRLVDLNNHAVRKILGMDQTKREIVLMLSQPQRIPLAQIHNWNPHEALVRPNAGKYPRLVASPIGAKLDGHDRRTMISNFTPGMHTLIPQANSALKIGRQCVLMGTNSTAIEQVNRLRQSPAPALSNRNSPQLRIARAS